MSVEISERSGGAFPWALRIVLIVGLLALLRVVMIDYEAAIRSISPGCVFRKMTGLDCPGCGGTRAFFALLKGDLARSWQMNPLLILGLVVGSLVGLTAWVKHARGGSLPVGLRLFEISSRKCYWAIALVAAFWILRNLPWWPFTLLSPSGPTF